MSNIPHGVGTQWAGPHDVSSLQPIAHRASATRARAQNITVRHSSLGSLGNNAMQIGSETVGNFFNISFSDIEVTSAGQAGIGVVTMDGAHVHHISYSRISMARTATPLFMYVGARQRRPPPKRIGSISHVDVSDVTAFDCYSDRHGPASFPLTMDGQPADIAWNATMVYPVGPSIRLQDFDLSRCSRGNGEGALLAAAA